MKYEYNTLYNHDSLAALENIKKQGLKFRCIFTDPPYGINFDKQNGYGRGDDRPNIIPGYVDIPSSQYHDFITKSISLANDCLTDDGLFILISGYTHIGSVQLALKQNNLHEINHLIWFYNFGQHCSIRHCSSHYHILIFSKKKRGHFYDKFCRIKAGEIDENGKSLNYRDRQSVITHITREKWSQKWWTTKNKLPFALIHYLYDYFIPKNDPSYSILDPFMGSCQIGKFFRSNQVNLKFTGIDIHDLYYNFACHRFKKDLYKIPVTEKIPKYAKSFSIT